MLSANANNQIQKMLGAIQLCLDHRFEIPALTLIYSTIDIMAWLNRDENHADVDANDFVRWVETYLLPDSDLPCTAIDLYAARCSLVHSYTAESRLSRMGKASQIYYTWGSADERELQRIIDWVGTRQAKAIHVDKLFQRVSIGIQRFIDQADKSDLVNGRANTFFADMPRSVSEWIKDLK